MSESRVEYRLGPYEPRAAGRLASWKEERLGRRLWEKDPAVWGQASAAEISNRLGWLALPSRSRPETRGWAALRDEVCADGIASVVLLGMGGSSLAPEVFQAVFGNTPGRPRLMVLDSTHPDAVRGLDARLDLAHTLFVVSSKSGTTIETDCLFRYFFGRLSQVSDRPGRHFVAITDPDTVLARTGAERGFRHVELAPSDVGGRYSALSAFGLLPASLIGADAGGMLERASEMAGACGPGVPEDANPGLRLGAALGELALAGRDKLTILASPSLASFPAWLEQLVAESTGKQGKGIVPIVDEPAPDGAGGAGYGDDRVLVEIGLAGEPPARPGLAASLESRGHPVIRMTLEEPADLGAEIFRWEIATAAACAVLAVHPFDQPDVELAKKLAREAIASGVAQGDAAGEIDAGDPASVDRALAALGPKAPGDYLCLQAYLAPGAETTARLQAARAALGDRTGLPTTLGYGPRFLHSTGQLHKGGPNTAVCVQIVDEPAGDLPIPEAPYTFAGLIRAQGLGDLGALRQRGRRVIRLRQVK